VRDPWDSWEKGGSRSALDNARARARDILAKGRSSGVARRALDAGVEAELRAFRAAVAARSLDEFYSYELPEMQDLEAL